MALPVLAGGRLVDFTKASAVEWMWMSHFTDQAPAGGPLQRSKISFAAIRPTSRRFRRVRAGRSNAHESSRSRQRRRWIRAARWPCRSPVADLRSSAVCRIGLARSATSAGQRRGVAGGVDSFASATRIGGQPPGRLLLGCQASLPRCEQSHRGGGVTFWRAAVGLRDRSAPVGVGDHDGSRIERRRRRCRCGRWLEGRPPRRADGGVAVPREIKSATRSSPDERFGRRLRAAASMPCSIGVRDNRFESGGAFGRPAGLQRVSGRGMAFLEAVRLLFNGRWIGSGGTGTRPPASERETSHEIGILAGCGDRERQAGRGDRESIRR